MAGQEAGLDSSLIETTKDEKEPIEVDRHSLHGGVAPAVTGEQILASHHGFMGIMRRSRWVLEFSRR